MISTNFTRHVTLFTGQNFDNCIEFRTILIKLKISLSSSLKGHFPRDGSKMTKCPLTLGGHETFSSCKNATAKLIEQKDSHRLHSLTKFTNFLIPLIQVDVSHKVPLHRNTLDKVGSTLSTTHLQFSRRKQSPRSQMFQLDHREYRPQ